MVDTPEKPDDKAETVDKVETAKEEKAVKEPARRKRTLRATTGKPISCGWT